MKIPDGWKETTLGEVLGKKGYIRGPFGSSLKRNEMLSEGIPVYEQQNVIYKNRQFRFFINQEKFQNLKRFTVQENDLLISCSGTVGRINIIAKNDPIGIISQALLILRPDIEKVIPSFLKVFFETKEGVNSLLSRSTGSVQVNIAERKIIEKIDFLLPPLPEQKAIADVLASFDNKIELLREQNKTLEAIAQTIFNEWFVRFNFPDENGKPYQTSGGKMIDSELGPIPEGWRVGKLDEITDLVTKGTTPTSIGGNFSKKGINFIKAESILETHAFDKSKISFIDEFSNNLLERSKLRENDFLITIAGTIGRFAIVTKALLPANTNQAIAIIRTKRAYSPFYLKCTFSVKGILQKLIGNVVEAVQANLSLTSIKNLKIVIPSDATMNLFEEKFCPQFDKINNNEIQIQTLTTLRDELLPKLMNGELRLKLDKGENINGTKRLS